MFEHLYNSIVSISIFAPFGSAAIAKAERAGYGALKNSAYTSLTATLANVTIRVMLVILMML